jgi:hypothetical protein
MYFTKNNNTFGCICGGWMQIKLRILERTIKEAFFAMFMSANL